MVQKINHKGKKLWSWCGAHSPVLQKAFNFSNRKIIYDFYNKNKIKNYQAYFETERLHLSGLCIHKGNIYVLSGKQSSLIKINPTDQNRDQVVITSNKLRSPHDCLGISENRLLINNTRSQKLCIVNLRDRKILNMIDTRVYKNVKASQFSQPGWQRGLAKWKDNLCIFGTSPCTLGIVNIKTKKVMRTIKIDNDVHICPYDICVVK